jgi:flagellar hook-length control protein FliK
MNISFFPSKTNEASQAKNFLNEDSNLSVDSILSNTQSSFLNYMKDSLTSPIASNLIPSNQQNQSNTILNFQASLSYQDISSANSASNEGNASPNNDNSAKGNSEISSNASSSNDEVTEYKPAENSSKTEEIEEELASDEEIEAEDEEVNLTKKDEGIFESITSWFQSLGQQNESKDTKAILKDKVTALVKKEIENDLKSANRENSKAEIKDVSEKSQKQQHDWEKKIVTTNDLFAKLTQAKSKNTDESKATQKSNQDGKTGEVKLTEKSLLASVEEVTSKSSNLEKVAVGNKESNRKVDQDSKSKKENKLETSEKTEAKDIPKLTIDRMEKGETPKDMNKWEIRQERTKQEFTNNQQASQNKDNVVSIESASSSNSSKSQSDTSKDQGSENFKAEMFKANFTKKPDSLAAKSSVYDPEEMKANMDKLVQKAKIQIINEGRSQAEIRLNPMELGRMVLKISVQNDKVQGKVLVDSETVKAALQNDLSSLKEDLRAQGLDLQSLTIDVNLDSHQDLQGRQDKFAGVDNFGNINKQESNTQTEVLRTNRVSDSLLDVIA